LEASFDHIAQEYDESFSFTSIGKAQRDRVWQELLPITHVKKCLEVNCGTGEDALKFAEMGVNVLATDLSSKMVEVTNTKLSTFGHKAKTLDINDLDKEDLSDIDLFFSNFGGLNCISPQDWEALSDKLISGLPKGGRIVFVIMSKKCLWERIYFFFKPKRKWNRNTNEPVEAHVDGKYVKTWYYSPQFIRSFFQGKVNCVKTKPIGFFIPPSYLEPFFKNRQWLLKILFFLEEIIGSFAILANYSDHYYMEFEK